MCYRRSEQLFIRVFETLSLECLFENKICIKVNFYDQAIFLNGWVNFLLNYYVTNKEFWYVVKKDFYYIIYLFIKCINNINHFNF